MEHRNTVIHAGSALPYSQYLLLQELSWTYGLCVSAGLLNISVSLVARWHAWPLFICVGTWQRAMLRRHVFETALQTACLVSLTVLRAS